MIKDALQYLEGLIKKGEAVQTFEHEGQTFTTRSLSRVPNEPPVPQPAKIPVATLRGLAAYIKDNPDGMEDGTFLNVVSPTRVEVITPIQGEDAVRQTFAIAEARLPSLRIGSWLSPEDLGVHLRTCFVESDARDEVVAFLGGIADKAELHTKDDGVSQSTTVRSGISMLKEGVVPSPVDLAPFRTFHDVEQPASPFILRLKKDPAGVVACLFEADGGAWQHEAAERVAKYLRENVSLEVYA